MEIPCFPFFFFFLCFCKGKTFADGLRAPETAIWPLQYASLLDYDTRFCLDFDTRF